MTTKRNARLIRNCVALTVLAASCTICLRANGQRDDVDHEIANMKDPASGIREAAARNLGEMGDPRAVPALIAALKDGDSEMRVAIVQSLAELKDARSIEPLAAVSRDNQDSEAASLEMLALGEFKDSRAVNALIEALKRSSREEDAGPASSLGRIGPLAVAPLMAELRDPEVAVRARALDGLGWIDDPRAVDALIEFVNDPNPELREAALSGLKGHWDAPGMLLAPFDIVHWLKKIDRTGGPIVRDRRIPKLLMAALNDSDAGVQSLAVEALGDYKESAAVEPLVALLKQSANKSESAQGRATGPKVRKAIAIALGDIGDPRAVAALIAESRDSDPEIRCWSARSLGEIKDVRATDALVVLLNDKNGNVRRETAEALGRIQDPRAVGPLIEAVKSACLAWEARLAEANSRTKGAQTEPIPPAAFSVGDPILGSATSALGQIGEPALPLLIEASKSTDSVFRQRVLAALSTIKSPAAVNTIVAALSDPDTGVRSAALEALASVNDPRAEWPFLTAWKEADPEARKDAMGFLCANDAPWASRPVEFAIRDKNSGFAERCLNSAGEIRTPMADAAASLLTDEDQNVRKMAAQALADILQNSFLFGQPAGPAEVRIEDMLRTSLNERNVPVICAAVYYFVGRGEEGSEDALIEALNTAGDEWMAQYLLTCGNTKLEIAGRAWLKNHHRQVDSRMVGPRWGELRVRPADPARGAS